MSTYASRSPSRRNVLGGILVFPFILAATPARAELPQLSFVELYGAISPLGLQFSDKTKSLAGQRIVMRGYMAPPLKAEAKFFVLAEVPMALCPFCSSDADWPSNIVVVYLDRAQTFLPPNDLIEVEGLLELGSWTDPETGFVSQIRLRNAAFSAA